MNDVALLRPRPRPGAHRPDQCRGHRRPPCPSPRSPIGSATAGTGSPSTTTCRRWHPPLPPVLIAAAATRTSRMRLGSGGVMLPNHAPLIVAEQFAALEAIAPGRIDLGLGRAPGSDPSSRSCCAARAPRATSSSSPATCRTSRRCSPPRAPRCGSPRAARVHRARDTRRDRHPRGVAARVERLLGAAGRLARSALRLREPLLGPGASSARSTCIAPATVRARSTRSRAPSSRSTRSPHPRRRRRRRAPSRSCA